MNVLIKVYDNNDYLGNIMVPLNIRFDKVIFLYRHVDKQRKAKALKNILLNNHINSEFIKVDDEKIIDELLLKYPKADIDITAVRYLSIYIFERVINKNNYIYYYNREDNNISDYRDHHIVVKDLKKLTIEEIVKLSGGDIKSSMHLLPNMNDKKNILKVINIIDEVIDNYQAFTSFISIIIDIITKENFYLNDYHLNYLKTNYIFNIMKKYEVLDIKENKLEIVNDYFMELFKNAGSWLESYLYIKIMESGLFDDAKMSAVIEFKDSDVRVPISCEIDVLVIKDNKLGLVSCKSNKVDTDAVNEIKVHNAVFGNHLSKPIIFTAEDMNIKNPAIFKKAQELKVRIIDKTAIENNAICLVLNKIFNDTYEYERVRE